MGGEDRAWVLRRRPPVVGRKTLGVSWSSGRRTRRPRPPTRPRHAPHDREIWRSMLCPGSRGTLVSSKGRGRLSALPHSTSCKKNWIKEWCTNYYSLVHAYKECQAKQVVWETRSLLHMSQRTYVFQNRLTWRCMNPEWTPCYDSRPIQSHPFHFLRCRGRSQPEDKKEMSYVLLFNCFSLSCHTMYVVFLSKLFQLHSEILEMQIEMV